MSKNKPLPTSAPESIESAWAEGDELAVVHAVVRKYARVLDMTDSGRDIKPLATGMFEAMDRARIIESARADAERAPLFRIIESAQNASA